MAKKKYNLLLLLPALLMAFSVSGCGRTVTTERFLQSYQIRSGTVIDIYNQNGSVTITGWDQDRVEISALKESYRGREALDQVDIFIDIAEKVIIKTVNAANDDQPVEHVTVNYEIKIPEDILTGIIECANGDVIIENVSGNPDIITSNGTISVKGINGIVTARSSNGSITVSGVKSLSGLRTSNGHIEAELPLLHDDLEIRTSNGSISLAISPALNADLEANTSNGTITITNLNITASEMEARSLSGSMNGGGYKINIVTSNGSIDLSPLR